MRLRWVRRWMAAAVDQGGGVYRYTFTGTFIAGAVGVTFTTDSFADLAGNTHVCDAEVFTVETADGGRAPTADLADPTNGGTIDATVLNSRGYIDVTFTDTGTVVWTSQRHRRRR